MSQFQGHRRSLLSLDLRVCQRFCADLDKEACKKAAELITWGSVDLSGTNVEIEKILQKSDAFDSSVPGVQHMPGGQQAANARWEAFKKNGLSQYAARRNNVMLRFKSLSLPEFE